MEQLVTNVQFRASATLDGNTLTGYAHVFGNRAQVESNRYEEFSPGAFDQALKRSDARATIQHDLTRLLGRQSAGTLRVMADEVGLRYQIDLPNTSYAQDLKELIARGDITEMSFGFIPGEAVRNRAKDGSQVRMHTSVKDLVDISPVAIPAFEGTSILVRSKSFEDESLDSQLVRARHNVLIRR